MPIDDRAMFRRLGAGDSIDAVCGEAGLARGDFDAWWRRQLESRLPEMDGSRKLRGVAGGVEILRDELGTPHIYADNDADLFFGYGFATGQDRLWQLDYLRRKATGRLSEVLGPSGIELDTIARTVGVPGIAAAEADRLPDLTLRRLKAFADGINGAMEEARDRLPIEFALLDYEPEPWSHIDSLALWAELRWYLTGRLPIIVIPEVAKRGLGEGPLYRAFLLGEADEESIVPPGHYEAVRTGAVPVGQTVSSPDEGLGSNNWVIGASLSESGGALVASDPHIAFGSVSCWYQVHLSGAGFNFTGSGYVGVPGVTFGRNDRVAWGVTNNICAQRDLYQEREHPDRPGHFLYDGEWEPAEETVESIAVKGADAVDLRVRKTRNGPIVDGIIPEEARETGPVSFRWMGHEACDEITGLLQANAAASAAGFREALRDWVVPTWSFGFADVDGHIGYQCVGRIPIKESWDRGYRPGWDPEHQWRGSVPFDALPRMEDPEQDWIRSANNRTAPEDFPYPLAGVWSSGHRALRIRQMIEERPRIDREYLAAMQNDSLSLRAVEGLPGLLRTLDGAGDERVGEAAAHLRAWDCRMETDRVGAAIFESFFYQWEMEVAAERFEGETARLLGTACGGLALSLLDGDTHDWFADGGRERAALRAMSRTLEDMEARLGADMAGWTWGAVHKIRLGHHLSERGGIFRALDRGGDPVRGNGVTVCNTGFDPNYLAAMGANYRINADLGEEQPGLWAIDAAGQSGNPGSPNYCDQLPTWLEGRHHYIPIDRERVERSAKTRLKLRGT